MASNKVSIRRKKGKRMRDGSKRDEPQAPPEGETPNLPAKLVPRGLSREQRVSLFGPGPGEDEVVASVTAAATGVGTIALQHIARVLTEEAPRPVEDLTVQDKMAMEMAPKIAAEMKRKSLDDDKPPPPGTDPIADLLERPPPTSGEDTVRISTGPRR